MQNALDRLETEAIYQSDKVKRIVLFYEGCLYKTLLTELRLIYVGLQISLRLYPSPIFLFAVQPK
jgi:hypothetical protein